MVQQIEQKHLDFLEDARSYFQSDTGAYTYRNGMTESTDTLIALRYGLDRDCILIYELGECVANFVQQMDPAPVPRESVIKFSHDMEKQMEVNDHKGCWGKEHHQDLSSLLGNNLEKLRKELFKTPHARDNHEITIRCANIANYAMMIADNEGEHL